MNVNNKLNKYQHLLLPIFAGIMLGLSRLPLKLGFLVFFSFIPLFTLFANWHKTKQIVLAAICFSSAFTLVSLHWISLVTIAGFIGLFFLFGFYFSLLFLAVNYVRKVKPKLTYLAFGVFWITFEYLQNIGELRFPWFNVGYSLADYNILIQVADLGGIFLVSACTFLLSYLIFAVIKKSSRYIFPLLALLLLWFGYGIYKYQTLNVTTTDTMISLVQASITQEQKWDPNFTDSTLTLYRKYTKLAAEANSDLIIWPESALPDYLMQRYSKFRRFLDKQIKLYDTDIFTGFPRYEFAPPNHSQKYLFYNSATLFKANKTVGNPYDKIALVPFGERMPFLKKLPILWKIELGQANFSYGQGPTYYSVKDYTFSPLICFEIAFPQLTANIMQKPTDFIVNITNDAWFKRSAGTYQHAILTKFRAVETRRAIYRAANTGYSMVIDPLGRVVEKTELYEKTTLNYPLIICKDKTFFTKYFNIIPVVCILFSIIIISLVIVGRIRNVEILLHDK